MGADLFQCNTVNFKKREYCFRCDISKEESELLSMRAGEGYDEIGMMPCDSKDEKSCFFPGFFSFGSISFILRCIVNAMYVVLFTC